LNSWKEIAAHLKVDPRTVQRWEKSEGMPVHRHMHHRTGTVYAYPSELDEWWESRRGRLEGETRAIAASYPPLLKISVAVGLFLIAAVVAYLRFAGLPFVNPQHNVAGVQGPTVSQRVLIAVLPFKNLSGDPGQEYISAGLTEEMITRLGGLRPERLGVIASQTVNSPRLRGMTAREIGERLGVDYVLEGSVRRGPNRVRVAAQLIHAHDETNLWAETYDQERAWEDILALQGDVATRIAESLAIELLPAEISRLRDPGSVNGKAIEEYLQGRDEWSRRSSDGLRQGLLHFERAVQLDPQYAAAYAGLADSYSMAALYEILPPEVAYPQARTAAEKALRREPTLAEARASLALVKLWYEWDWFGAREDLIRALRENPSYAPAHHWYGLLLMALQRRDEAIAQLAEAQKLDPDSPVMASAAGDILLIAGQFDLAIQQYRRALDMDPNAHRARLNLAWAMAYRGDYAAAESQFEQVGDAVGRCYVAAVAGRHQSARAMLDKLVSDARHGRVSPYDIAVIHTALGSRDEAFRWLDKAYLKRSPEMVFVNVDPGLRTLRSDPRFAGLVSRMGLQDRP